MANLLCLLWGHRRTPVVFATTGFIAAAAAWPGARPGRSRTRAGADGRRPAECRLARPRRVHARFPAQPALCGPGDAGS